MTASSITMSRGKTEKGLARSNTGQHNIIPEKEVYSFMKMSVSFDDFGEHIEAEYEMKRPNVIDISMMMKQSQQQDLMAASKSFCLSLCEGAEKERFLKDFESHPGIAVAIANKLVAASGLTADVAKKN